MRHHNLSSSIGTVAMVAVLGLLSGCGSSAGGQAAPDPSAVACADVATLKSSLETLTDVEPLQDGLTALNAAVDTAKTNLDTAAASASAALEPAVTQVKTAFTALETSVTGLSADNLAAKAPSIKAALTEVGTATTALGASLTEGCPGS